MPFAVSSFCFFRLVVRDSFSRTANFPFPLFGYLPLFKEIPAFRRLFSGSRIAGFSCLCYAAILCGALHPGILSRGQSAAFCLPALFAVQKGRTLFSRLLYKHSGKKSTVFAFPPAKNALFALFRILSVFSHFSRTLSVLSARRLHPFSGFSQAFLPIFQASRRFDRPAASFLPSFPLTVRPFLPRRKRARRPGNKKGALP